jgi:hypothetical protein
VNALRAALAACACALAFAAAPLPVWADDPLPTGDAILARAKATFHGSVRPPFVSYTLVREEQINGRPDLADTYTLRVWCRASDRAALVRSVQSGVANGPLRFVRPAFNQPLDPGPPTADIFERGEFSSRAIPPPTPSPPPGQYDDLRTLAAVEIHGETDYRVEGFEVEGASYRLHLVARREPERNRLRELWVDRSTFELERAIATDTLFSGGERIPEAFDMSFEMRDGVPVIRTIRMHTGEGSAAGRPALDHRGEYRFEEIAFPASLPDWYFKPALYGPKFDQAPR